MFEWKAKKRSSISSDEKLNSLEIDNINKIECVGRGQPYESILWKKIINTDIDISIVDPRAHYDIQWDIKN